MKLHRLNLENFKGVTHRQIEFPETGVSVIQGPNEAGKTSTIQALDLLLTTLPDSKKAVVKSARPEGQDVPVTVEAEFTVAEHRVRYRKQWLKNPGADLEFVAGPRRGERATGREAHAAVDDLLAPTDRTLWNTLRLLQSDALSNDFAGSSALRKALEAAGGEVADDAASVSLVQAARAERDLYFTPTGQEKSDTKRLRENHTAATTAYRKAQADLDAVTGLVDDFDRKDRLARSAQVSHDRALEDFRAAERAAEEVEHLDRRRQEARAASSSAGAAHQRATELLQERENLRDRAERTAEKLQELETSLDAAQEAADQTATSTRAAEATVHQAREDLDRARNDLDLAQKAQRRTRDQARWADLTALVKQLDDLTAREAALDDHVPARVTPELLEQLERAHRAADLARTQLESASARMTVTALGDPPEMALDGQPLHLSLGESTEQAVTEDVTLELPGRLRVQISPEQGLAQRRAAVQRAQEDVDRLLGQAAMDSLEAARTALEAQTRHERAVTEAVQQRRLLLNGREETRLRSELATLTSRLESTSASTSEAADGTEDTTEREDDTAGLDERLDRAEALAGDARQALTAAENRADLCRTAETKAAAQLNSIRTDHSSQTLLLRDQESQLQQARAAVSDEALENDRDQKAAALEQATALVDALEHQWISSEAQAVLDRMSAYEARVSNTRRSLERARTERTLVQGNLEATDRDSRQRTYDQAATALRQVTQELNTQVRRAAAAKLLAETLKAAQLQAHRRYNAPFRARLEQLGHTVFGSTFRVELSDDLVITRRFLDGTWLSVDSLSTGAREQLDVLVRLAIAMLVDPMDGVPVIFDDALGHTDPERLISLSTALRAAGDHAQVIVLTAMPDRFASIPGATVIDV